MAGAPLGEEGRIFIEILMLVGFKKSNLSQQSLTESLHLKNMGVNVTLAHWTDKLDAQDFLAKQLTQSDIEILYNTVVTEILGEKSVEAVSLHNTQTNETKKVKVAGVFISIGYLPATDLAEKIGLALTRQGFIKQDQYQTSIPGVYAAGDVVGGYNQIVTAAAAGGPGRRAHWMRADPDILPPGVNRNPGGDDA